MKIHLPDHAEIYMSIRLGYNHEITYTYHMRLYTTVQVLGRHQAALAKVSNSFQSSWSCRPCLDRVNLHQNHSSGGWHLNYQLPYAVYFHGLWHLGIPPIGVNLKSFQERWVYRREDSRANITSPGAPAVVQTPQALSPAHVGLHTVAVTSPHLSCILQAKEELVRETTIIMTCPGSFSCCCDLTPSNS